MRREIRSAVPYMAATAICSVVLLSTACKRGESGGAGDTTMSSMAAPESTAVRETTPAATTAPAPAAGMTDAQILARVAAANRGEIAAGKMAESKATNADVKAFARMMVTDHTRLLNEGNALAKRLKITPDTAAADSIRNADMTTADQLRAAAKGMTFDTTYVNAQVAGHQATLDMLKNASDQAQDADLKKALNDAMPVVQRHLDRIKDIQGKLK